MKKARATVVAITSDQHCGSTVALCPPTIKLDDGGEYHASKPQRWLWQSWETFWSHADAAVKEHDARLVQVFNGDMTDGDHHGTTQILSGNPTGQAAAVNECMRAPLALDPDAMFFIRGTEAHVGKSACHEERIASGLRKDKRPVIGDEITGTASHWHKAMEIDGVRIDFAHHGRVGQRPWTKQNVTNLLAFQIWTEHHLRNSPHPHFAIRSHLHQHVDTGRAHQTRVIQTPAWQLHTAFTHKVVTESLADIGGILLIIRDGKCEPIDILFEAEASPVWKP